MCGSLYSLASSQDGREHHGNCPWSGHEESACKNPASISSAVACRFQSLNTTWLPAAVVDSWNDPRAGTRPMSICHKGISSCCSLE